MRKRLLAATAIVVAAVMIWAYAQVVAPPKDLPSLLPDGALLYIQSPDFAKLLGDWNSSVEKRTWIEGDDYAAFSRSRLFERLQQAQSEFSAAASISADQSLLSSVAGSESALALYDIGNLQFVYVTRMAQLRIEATPLWQARNKFEQRTEGSAHFYVRVDQQSSRTAAFAAMDGWLILGTREDLVAGVLDRLQQPNMHSLADESWYADSTKLAAGPAGDLRTVLNLEKIVPSPYFRSYWVQGNVTEMKQYRAAISDLHRSSGAYREDRVLLRKPGANAAKAGNVRPLLDLAPSSADFSSAQAAPDAPAVLASLRENLLELKPVQQQAQWSAAPPPVQVANAGSPTMLEERIDVAPVLVAQTDPHTSLRGVLVAAQPSALLQTFVTRSERNDMFVAIDRAVVVDAVLPWNQPALQSAISAALRPGLTASQMGLEWTQHPDAAGGSSSLNGRVSLFMAIRGNRLFMTNSEFLLSLLLRRQRLRGAASGAPLTAGAVFEHGPHEQQMFLKLAGRLDTAGHVSSGNAAADGQSPAFLSGNIASLSRMFSQVERETVEERDEGAQVMQTVTYAWRNP